MRHEVESVTARMRYLSEAHETVQGDIALTKRATEKTATDVSKAQEEKLQQVHILCIELQLLPITLSSHLPPCAGPLPGPSNLQGSWPGRGAGTVGGAAQCPSSGDKGSEGGSQ